jgi:tRNA(Leu) C34 or U34 (ribose-2'-O)-methylase TrmL
MVMEQSEIILVNPKYTHNLAAAIRACSCFGVNKLTYTDSRLVIADKERLPREERMKGYKSVKWVRNDFPLNGRGTPVCVEVMQNSEPLTTFKHPIDAIYVFGPEDGSVPKTFKLNCHRFLHIPAHHYLNLAAAVNVVLAHRFMQLSPILPLDEILHETRGEIDLVGREGR